MTDFAVLWKATAKKLAGEVREVDLIGDALRQAVVQLARQRDEAVRERDRFADAMVGAGEDADRYMVERDTLRAAIREALKDIRPSRILPPSEVGYLGSTRDVQHAREVLSRAIDMKETKP